MTLNLEMNEVATINQCNCNPNQDDEESWKLNKTTRLLPNSLYKSTDSMTNNQKENELNHIKHKIFLDLENIKTVNMIRYNHNPY